jgi:hypothetical protein
LVLYGEVNLSDPLNEELPVLVALFAVSLDDLGTLKEVVPLTNLEGCWAAARGGGGRGRHEWWRLCYNEGRVNHFEGVVKGPKMVVFTPPAKPV